MRAALQRQLTAYEASRQAVLEEVTAVSPEASTARPLAGGWSVLEIAEHLALAERDVLRGLPDWRTLRAAPQSFWTRLRGRALLTLLRSRMGVSTPSKSMDPTGMRSLREVRALWDANVSWLREFVSHADENVLAEAVFSHPVSGPLTLSEMLTLAEVHLARHRKQIQARIQAAG